MKTTSRKNLACLLWSLAAVYVAYGVVVVVTGTTLRGRPAKDMAPLAAAFLVAFFGAAGYIAWPRRPARFWRMLISSAFILIGALVFVPICLVWREMDHSNPFVISLMLGSVALIAVGIDQWPRLTAGEKRDRDLRKASEKAREDEERAEIERDPRRVQGN